MVSFPSLSLFQSQSNSRNNQVGFRKALAWPSRVDTDVCGEEGGHRGASGHEL